MNTDQATCRELVHNLFDEEITVDELLDKVAPEGGQMKIFFLNSPDNASGDNQERLPSGR